MRAYFLLDFKPHLILAHVRFKNGYTKTSPEFIQRIWSKMRAYFVLDFKPHLILAHVRFKNDYTKYPQNVSIEYGV